MRQTKVVRTIVTLVLAGALGASLTGCIAEEILEAALNTRTLQPGERAVLAQTFSRDGAWAVACNPGLPDVSVDVRLFGPSGALADAGSFTGADVVGGVGEAGGRVEVTVENESGVVAAISLNAN